MRRFAVAFLGLFVLLLSGCGGIHGDNGTLAFELVDAPASHVSSLQVVIKRIDVEVGGEWITLAYPNQSYELLDLQLEPALLGQAGLAEGTYSKIRVAITSATVTDANGTWDVFVPESVRTDGLEIMVTFDMESARRTTLLLDFNVLMSLKINPGGWYSLEPVIPTVVKEESGTVTGFVGLSLLPVEGAEIEAEYVSGPNYAPGTVVNHARSQVGGAFRLWALLPGEYKLHVTFDSLGVVSKTTVNGVVVAAGLDTPIGDVSLD